MEIVEVKGAIDALGTAFAEFKNTVTKEQTELKARGFVSAETLEKLAKINDALDAAEAAKSAAEKTTARVDALETAIKRPSGGANADESKAAAIEHKKALDTWLRKGSGEAELQALQTKTLQVGVQSDGGYLVTVERDASVRAYLAETNGMRQVASVMSTSANTFEVVRETSTLPAGGWVSESGARTATGTPTFGITRIEPGENYVNVPVTQTMLDDAAIDVEAFIAGKAAQRFSIDENTAFITGNGIGKPRGILTYASGTGDQQIEQVVSGGAADLTAAGLINLQQTLFEQLQPRAQFMFSRATLGRIRRFTEAVNGQFLWQPGLAAGVPPTLLGKPYVIASDMPTIGASSLSVAYGDFGSAYAIVDRIGIRTLRDPYTSKPNVLFYVTKRTGGDVVQFQSVKLQVTSA